MAFCLLIRFLLPPRDHRVSEKRGHLEAMPARLIRAKAEPIKDQRPGFFPDWHNLSPGHALRLNARRIRRAKAEGQTVKDAQLWRQARDAAGRTIGSYTYMFKRCGEGTDG